jgi:hypothetical protein
VATKIVVGVFYAVHVVSKQSGQLVLPRISCLTMLSVSRLHSTDDRISNDHEAAGEMRTDERN